MRKANSSKGWKNLTELEMAELHSLKIGTASSRAGSRALTNEDRNAREVKDADRIAKLSNVAGDKRKQAYQFSPALDAVELARSPGRRSLEQTSHSHPPTESHRPQSLTLTEISLSVQPSIRQNNRRQIPKSSLKLVSGEEGRRLEHSKLSRNFRPSTFVGPHFKAPLSSLRPSRIVEGNVCMKEHKFMPEIFCQPVTESNASGLNCPHVPQLFRSGSMVKSGSMSLLPSSQLPSFSQGAVGSRKRLRYWTEESDTRDSQIGTGSKLLKRTSVNRGLEYPVDNDHVAATIAQRIKCYTLKTAEFESFAGEAGKFASPSEVPPIQFYHSYPDSL